MFERQSEPMPNSGMHEREGILLSNRPDIRSGSCGIHNIYDVDPTLVHLHGHTVSDSIDGEVIKSMVTPGRPVESDGIGKPESCRIQSRIPMLRQIGGI